MAAAIISFAGFLEILERERAPPAVQEAAVRSVLARLQIISVENCGGKICFIINNQPSFGQKGAPQILIQGVSGVELSAGLHWYLKHWCNAHISWGKTGGIHLSSVPKEGFLPFVKPDAILIQRPVPYFPGTITRMPLHPVTLVCILFQFICMVGLGKMGEGN